jgi:hypothetical protein
MSVLRHLRACCGGGRSGGGCGGGGGGGSGGGIGGGECVCVNATVAVAGDLDVM